MPLAVSWRLHDRLLAIHCTVDVYTLRRRRSMVDTRDGVVALKTRPIGVLQSLISPAISARPVRWVVSRFKMVDCLQNCTIPRMSRGRFRQDQRSLRKSDSHAQRLLQATARAGSACASFSYRAKTSAPATDSAHKLNITSL